MTSLILFTFPFFQYLALIQLTIFGDILYHVSERICSFISSMTQPLPFTITEKLQKFLLKKYRTSFPELKVSQRGNKASGNLNYMNQDIKQINFFSPFIADKAKLAFLLCKFKSGLIKQKKLYALRCSLGRIIASLWKNST